MRIALTGGGSGGHLFPILAVAQEIKIIVAANVFQIAPGEGTAIEFMFIGPKTVGEEMLAEEKIAHKTIMAGKLRRYAAWQNVWDIFKIPCGLAQSLWHLFWFMPNVIFSKGGYGAVPVVLAGWIWRIPVIIHESDSVPGLANKFCAIFSRRVAISFNEAAKYFPAKKTALIGNPVRPSLFGGTKDGARQLFSLSAMKPVLLILGGSQGAQAINDLIFTSLMLIAPRCEIIHQCGANNVETVKQLLGDKMPADYHLFAFLDNEQMRQALAAADLVIARAGAGTIAEIAAMGKASILIPLPNAAADHQLKNATEFAHLGGTIIMEEMNLTPHLFQNEIFSLLDNPDLMKKMGERAKQFAHPDAAQRLAQEILNLAKR